MDRILLFSNSKDDQGKHSKKLILEITLIDENIKNIKKILRKRNHLIYYKAALAEDPCSVVRESYFSTNMRGLNLKGFLNLGILLMFANNFMLILDNFLRYGILLQGTVSQKNTNNI